MWGWIGCVAVLASACHRPSDSAPAVAPSEPAVTSPEPAGRPDAAVDVAPRPESPAEAAPASAEAGFAPEPRSGWVIRSSCRMGSCAWIRYEEVRRAGSVAAPDYQLRITQGDSRHPGDYPLAPEGVTIGWDARAQSARVRCSRTEPYAAVDDRGDTLKLNPSGVSGADQGLANFYFATCHGAYGDDAALAARFGYDLR